jgi:hypothetical protein
VGGGGQLISVMFGRSGPGEQALGVGDPERETVNEGVQMPDRLACTGFVQPGA